MFTLQLFSRIKCEFVEERDKPLPLKKTASVMFTGEVITLLFYDQHAGKLIDHNPQPVNTVCFREIRTGSVI